MNPTEALAQSDRKDPADATSAPEAVGWLNHPEPTVKSLTLAQRLAAEPPWTGPDEDDPEAGNPDL